MTKVHILCGGGSAEREVSLRSGAAVATALTEAGYDVTVLDPSSSTIDEITRCDIVFPVLHGAGGEDGTIQKELKDRDTKYVGSSSVASALCFDKWQYRQLIMAHDLPVATGALVQIDNYQEHPLTAAPYVLKPINGGSSIDTYITHKPLTAPHDKITDSFKRYPTMLLEQLVSGTELTVGVLGDTTLPIIEIIPPSGGEFDYENKYNGATQEIIAPKHISQDTQEAAQRLALKAHRLTGCRDLSRTDIMCDKSGQLFILETNTMPGMTNQSLFPKMAAAAGLPMSELCQKLIELALKH